MIGEVVGLTTVGISAFAGKKILERIDRHDLATALMYSVEFSALAYVLYKSVEFINTVLQLYGV